MWIEIDSNGTKWYYNNHILSRLDGPAVEYMNGEYSWYKEGNLHRIGGPAFYDLKNNYYEWWLNHKQVNPYYIYG